MGNRSHNLQSSSGESFTKLIPSAVADCRAAQNAWANYPVDARSDILARLARRIEQETPLLVQLMAVETGKPVRFGMLEVQRATEMLRAIMIRANRWPVSESAGAASLHRVPHGTVAVITPWNNPVYIALGKIAPALICGNAVVWKPAPAAQAVAEHLARLFQEVSLPPGVLRVVPGGSHAAEALMAHDGIGAVTLTGSLAAGRGAVEICANRFIPLQAELGGNNSALVWHDANLPEAARQIAGGAFAMAGQRCTANRRAVVHRSCLPEFLHLLQHESAAMVWDDPLNPATLIGPLVSAASRERISRVVEDAEKQLGPAIRPCGTGPPTGGTNHDGRWYPPSILCSPDPSLEIVQQETFGPVLVLQPADDWEHAMSLVNGVRQGLAAAIFTESAELMQRFAQEAQAGIVKINLSTADAEVDVPFGGWKASGVGMPEHGEFDREFYTRPQTRYARASPTE